MTKEFTSSTSAERPAAAPDFARGRGHRDLAGQVLLTWRLIFRQIHNEKADKDRKDRGVPSLEKSREAIVQSSVWHTGLKVADLVEPDMPRLFLGIGNFRSWASGHSRPCCSNSYAQGQEAEIHRLAVMLR